MNVENIGQLFNRYVDFINRLSDYNRYNNNIKHLLYIIIPSFIYKYGVENEKVILDCFSKTLIYESDKIANNHVSAFFGRNLRHIDSNYQIDSYVIINKNTTNNFIELLDAIIHEFNHAINSIKNEMKIDDKNIYLRTGISYIKYDKSDITKPISKNDNYILEEIINTKQTSDIMNWLNTLNSVNINNYEVTNLIDRLKSEFGKQYTSQAYLLQSYVCKTLVDNKSFMRTLEKLRYAGQVDEIEYWFDNITGRVGDFNKINSLLLDLSSNEEKMISAKIFKNKYVNNIRKINNSIVAIIDTFNNNCVYK